ncbi:tetratricopeptide repeat protein [Gammaproteobacteria bacterium]|jgi:predicted negative regulator of RcsB-dependent stress response|nr:tetratricopeptide repeat protein [Gammaproteobacteria bacterium]
MSSEYTEEEDKLISWFKDNYKNIIFGLLFGTTLVFGFKYYNDLNANKQYEMSLKYEEAIKDYQDEKYEKVILLSEEYQASNPSGIYTSMVNLYVAKIYHDEGKYPESLETLNFIIKNSNSKEMKMVANVRYSRILILQEKYNEAENFIVSAENFNDNALLIEMLGDISYVKSDIDKAKKYYESCLKLEITPNNRKIIENKLNSIQ